MKKQTEIDGHKATIETIVNTAAISLTAFGVTEIMNKSYYGFVVVAFGMALEFFKYFGRHKKLW